MTSVNVLDLWQSALITTVLVASPFILSALAMGIVMSLFQAATQLQENALTFIPKIVTMGVVLAVAGSWVLGQLVRFFQSSAGALVALGQGAGR